MSPAPPASDHLGPKPADNKAVLLGSKRRTDLRVWWVWSQRSHSQSCPGSRLPSGGRKSHDTGGRERSEAPSSPPCWLQFPLRWTRWTGLRLTLQQQKTHHRFSLPAHNTNRRNHSDKKAVWKNWFIHLTMVGSHVCPHAWWFTVKKCSELTVSEALINNKLCSGDNKTSWHWSEQTAAVLRSFKAV